MLRNVCFTSFEVKEPYEVKISSDHIRYCVYQVERAPTTERLHYQGYVEFNGPVRLNRAIELLSDFGPSPHVEARRGSQQQAIDYCRKPETRIAGPWEHGMPKSAGRPSSAGIAEAIGLFQSGGLAAVAETNPAAIVKYGRGLQLLASLKVVKRTWKTEVILITGDSGSGKTRMAWELCPNAYPKSDDSKWWDGYNGTDDIIWDDIDFSHVNYQYLLKIMDRYPMQVQYKGGFIWFAPKKLVLTCVNEPDLDIQFWRRVTRRLQTQTHEGGPRGADGGVL